MERKEKKKKKIKVEGEPLQWLRRDTGRRRPSYLIVFKYSSELMDQFGGAAMERVFKPQSLCAEWKSKMKRDAPKQKTSEEQMAWKAKNRKKIKENWRKRQEKPVNPGRKNHCLPRRTQMNAHTNTHTQGHVTGIHMCRCEEETEILE